MRYSPSQITAAAHVVHNNYSEVELVNAPTGEMVWAEGTVRAMIDRLGMPQDHADLRVFSLAQGAALASIWSRVTGWRETVSSDPNEIAEAIIQKLDSQTEQIEVTDAQVEALGNAIYGPAVVWDREKIRNGLVLALQSR